MDETSQERDHDAEFAHQVEWFRHYHSIAAHAAEEANISYATAGVLLTLVELSSLRTATKSDSPPRGERERITEFVVDLAEQIGGKNERA